MAISATGECAWYRSCYRAQVSIVRRLRERLRGSGDRGPAHLQTWPLRGWFDQELPEFWRPGAAGTCGIALSLGGNGTRGSLVRDAGSSCDVVAVGVVATAAVAVEAAVLAIAGGGDVAGSSLMAALPLSAAEESGAGGCSAMAAPAPIDAGERPPLGERLSWRSREQEGAWRDGTSDDAMDAEIIGRPGRRWQEC